MSPPRLLRLVCALVLWAAAPPAAWAGTTKVFPLSSINELPAGLEGTPERLTNVIAKMVGAKVSDSSIKGAALAAGCKLNDSGCLDQIARANRAKEIVFGTIRVGDDLRVFVKLTRFIAGTERRERTFVLTAETPQALARQLARSAREMFELAEEEEPPEEPVRPPRPPKNREPVGEEGLPEEEGLPRKGPEVAGGLTEGPPDGPPDAPGRVRRGRVTAGTYFLLSGGVMAVATGTGFAIGAYSLRDDLIDARDKTPDDTRRLAAIERALRVRSTVATVLLVGGGLAVAGGVVRAVLQRRPIDDDPPAVSVVPVDGGGAALIFSGRLP